MKTYLSTNWSNLSSFTRRWVKRWLTKPSILPARTPETGAKTGGLRKCITHRVGSVPFCVGQHQRWLHSTLVLCCVLSRRRQSRPSRMSDPVLPLINSLQAAHSARTMNTILIARFEEKCQCHFCAQFNFYVCLWVPEVARQEPANARNVRKFRQLVWSRLFARI